MDPERPSIARSAEDNADQHVPVEPPEVTGFPNYGYMALQGVCNARDLGGLPTKDGRRIKKRRLMRSGDLSDASASDLKQLVHMHDMVRVVDLRTQQEIDAQPAPHALLQDIEYEHLPVLPEDAIIAVGITNIAKDTRLAREFAAHPFDTIQELYPKALLGELGMTNYAAFLHGLLDVTDGATLWHCTQGKDRTGMAAILVEWALGVPEDVIRDDYLATNLFIRGWMDKVQRFLSDKSFARGLDAGIEAYGFANPSYYDAAMKAMNGVFGSVDDYLEKGLDFGPDECAKLREMYLR